MASEKQINILFTSVGRRVELLRAFRDAYTALNVKGQIVALDIDPLAPALQLADRPYIVPRLNNAEYIPTLTEICRRESIDLIFPLIDPDIPMLDQHRETIEATGARLAVVRQRAVEIISDKWETFEFFRSIDLPVPRSWLPEHRADIPDEYPLFIKPRFGSAGKNIFKVNNQKELDFFLEYVPQPIVQEYLPGPEITNDLVCDLQGSVMAVVSRRRIEVRWGEVAKGVTFYDPAIGAACVKVAEALPAVGPITLQCMMKDEVPYFTEINARLGGGVPLGIAAGVNSPALFIAQAAGHAVDIPPLGTYEMGLYLTRYDDGFFLSGADYEQMASHRL
jgi:carbamoyl-phosphate synthase large subunit